MAEPPASETGPRQADQLFALVYDELRRIARSRRRQAGNPATLDTTALINETWLKLAASREAKGYSRAHFLSLAARAMRQVLVDHARRIGAGKRGGGAAVVTLDERIPEMPSEACEVLALDQALDELEKIDARAARVVQLHFFGGLTFPEIAELEGLNERTIKRDWQAARLVLAATMNAHG